MHEKIPGAKIVIGETRVEKVLPAVRTGPGRTEIREFPMLVTPMANGVEWSLFDGGVGYDSTVLIQGPGQQGLSQTVVCKQAGASLIIVTGTSKDAARMKVAKELGADYVIDVQKEDP